jgi:nicotinamide riboside kinase
MTNETSTEVQWPNIYIVGAQSTGKTTLVDGLESFIISTRPDIPHPVIIREVARDVLKEHQFGRDEIRSSKSRSFELQKLILERQSITERDAPSNWIISDRSGQS